MSFLLSNPGFAQSSKCNYEFQRELQTQEIQLGNSSVLIKGLNKNILESLEMLFQFLPFSVKISKTPLYLNKNIFLNNFHKFRICIEYQNPFQQSHSITYVLEYIRMQRIFKLMLHRPQKTSFKMIENNISKPPSTFYPKLYCFHHQGGRKFSKNELGIVQV